LELVVNILLSNGYSLDLIFNKINQRIKHLISSGILLNQHDGNISTQIGDPAVEETNEKLLVIPYINNISEMFVSSIRKSNVLVGYRCLNKLNRIIRTHKKSTFA